MMRVLIYTSIFTLVFGELEAEDWPQWLGINRDAVWQETGIINTFDESKPKLIWKSAIGGGYSGPAVSDGQVFVMDRVGHDTDLKNGSLLSPRILSLRQLLGSQELSNSLIYY